MKFDRETRICQRGQATTEFAVLALVLVPLFIVVPLIGKYMDMNQTTEQASRYVAFEAAERNSSSTWKTDAELGTEVRRRFFSNSDAPVKTNDTAGDMTTTRNPLWTDHVVRPLISNFEGDVGVASTIEGVKTIDEIDPIGSTNMYRHEIGNSNDNLYTANVTLKIADIAGFTPFDKIGLTTTRRTVLIVDAWAAKDSASIRSTIEDSLVMYPIGKLKLLLDPLGQLPTLLYDPALKVSDFDWDVVPCDRIVEGC